MAFNRLGGQPVAYARGCTQGKPMIVSTTRFALLGSASAADPSAPAAASASGPSQPPWLVRHLDKRVAELKTLDTDFADKEFQRLVQVPGIKAACGAQSQPDAMQADGVALTRLTQHSQRGAAFGKKILGMNLDEVEVGQRLQQVAIVWMSPAYSGRDKFRSVHGERNEESVAMQRLTLSMNLPACGAKR